MTLYNATDIPLEIQGRVLVPGRSLDFQETALERTAVQLGILTTTWPAPVDYIRKNFGPGVHALKTVITRF